MDTMKVIYQRETQSISLRTFPSNCTVRCLGTCMQWLLLYIILWLISIFGSATSMLEAKNQLSSKGTTIGIQHRRWVLFLWGVLLKSSRTSWTKQMTLVKHLERTTVWNIHGGSEHDDQEILIVLCWCMCFASSFNTYEASSQQWSWKLGIYASNMQNLPQPPF